MLSITTLSIMTVSNCNVYAECHYVNMESVFNAECQNYACYAEYYYAEWFMLNVLAPCEHALKHQLSSSSCKESSLRNVKKSTLFYSSFSHPQF
jgi:hypothetical protein